MDNLNHKQWKKLLCNLRFTDDYFLISEDKDYHRSTFHQDYDKIVFSSAFRRLSNKTQVHTLSKNDHVHCRLTHSLEVASVGRSLATKAGKILKDKFDKKIKIDDVVTVVQTACLAHDIGNPPFGHATEQVITEWFSNPERLSYLNELTKAELNDFLHFDGNAQSFRILSQLKNNRMKPGGMNISYATMGTLVKYPFSSSRCEINGHSKFNFFQSEKDHFDEMFSEMGLKLGNNHYLRHPLSFLMEAADDICYCLIDLQDAYELNIISMNDIDDICDYFCSKKEKSILNGLGNLRGLDKVSKLVSVSINKLTNETIKTFDAHTKDIFSENQPKDLISLFKNRKLKKGIERAKQLASNKIFNDKRKIQIELGAYNVIGGLLDNFIPAAYSLHHNGQERLSFRDKRVLDLIGYNNFSQQESLYSKYQIVLDHIVGMTDSHAKYTSEQLNGIHI